MLRMSHARMTSLSAGFRRATSSLFSLAVLVGLVAAPVAAEETTHVVTGIRSAQEVRSDLRFVVSDLAGERASYDDLLDPFIETLLFGLNTSQPQRFDLVLSDKEEFTLLMVLPLADEKEFIRNNLEPVSIKVRKSRRPSGRYKLTGNVYEGVMQVDGRYALIARDEDYLPSGSAAAGRVLPGLLDQPQWDVVLHVGPESGDPNTRVSVAEAVGARRTEKLSRKADETPEEFALRKVLASHSAARLKRLLGGVDTLDLKLAVDSGARNSRSLLSVKPRSGTDLAEGVEKIGSEPYPFAAVPTTDDATLSGRMQWMMTDARRERMTESIEAARPVAKQAVEESTGTDAQKDARRKLNELIYDLLTDNTTQSAIDLFGEVKPAGGSHTGIMGISAADTSKVEEMLDLLVAGYDDTSVEKNVGEVTTGGGETITLHKVKLPEVSPILRNFFGTGTGLIGVGEKHVYGAIGSEGEATLKAALATIDGPGQPSENVASLRMHAGPIAELVNDLLTNNQTSLVDFLRQRRQQRRPNADRRVQVGDPEAYRRVMVQAMKSGNDVVEMTLKKTDGQLIGDATAGESVLRGIGEAIAKFAEDNLR